jgi:hypothetical protein
MKGKGKINRNEIEYARFMKISTHVNRYLRAPGSEFPNLHLSIRGFCFIRQIDVSRGPPSINLIQVTLAVKGSQPCSSYRH